MKNKLRRLLQNILRLLAKAILDKYQPEVVAITGSVGKTSTKEAIFTVLNSTYNCRTNFKNYNNEIGIPLTIIGAESGNQSAAKWLLVIIKALRLIILKAKKYPNILVLEMGADHPGDIKYLAGLVPIRVAVVTAVAPVHLEFFETIDQVAKEKANLVRALPKNGWAVLNHDIPLVASMEEKTNANILTFGFNHGADIRGAEIAISHEVDYKDVSTIQGISFKLIYQGKVIPVLLPKVLGEHLVYTALAAIAVGTIYELNLHTIIESLKNYEPPKGRMHIITGIKNTLIIDDTYNSSPLAATEALHLMAQVNIDSIIKNTPCSVICWNSAVTANRRIKRWVRQWQNTRLICLVTVGERSRDTVRAAIKKGLGKDNCLTFDPAEEAGRFLQDRIRQGDLILVKGSQGMRMEKIVKGD